MVRAQFECKWLACAIRIVLSDRQCQLHTHNKHEPERKKTETQIIINILTLFVFSDEIFPYVFACFTSFIFSIVHTRYFCCALISGNDTHKNNGVLPFFQNEKRRKHQPTRKWKKKKTFQIICFESTLKYVRVQLLDQSELQNIDRRERDRVHRKNNMVAKMNEPNENRCDERKRKTLNQRNKNGNYIYFLSRAFHFDKTLRKPSEKKEATISSREIKLEVSAHMVAAVMMKRYVCVWVRESEKQKITQCELKYERWKPNRITTEMKRINK